MKFSGTLLALSVFHPTVWGTTAFLVQAPKPLTSKGWKTTDALTLTTTFSYLGNLGQPPGSGDSKEGGASGKKNPSVSTADASRTVCYQKTCFSVQHESQFFSVYFSNNPSLCHPKPRHRKPWKSVFPASTPVAALPLVAVAPVKPKRRWMRPLLSKCKEALSRHGHFHPPTLKECKWCWQPKAVL